MPGRQLKNNFFNGPGWQLKGDFSKGKVQQNRSEISNGPGRLEKEKWISQQTGEKKKKKRGKTIRSASGNRANLFLRTHFNWLNAWFFHRKCILFWQHPPLLLTFLGFSTTPLFECSRFPPHFPFASFLDCFIYFIYIYLWFSTRHLPPYKKICSPYLMFYTLCLTHFVISALRQLEASNFAFSLFDLFY